MKILQILALLLLPVLPSYSQAAVPLTSALALRDIAEFETFTPDNIDQEESHPFVGCLAGRTFVRGDIIKPEDVVCVGSYTTLPLDR